MKLPGHDTLRLILANRCILVEGPSDELVVQKAYHCKHDKMPLNDGIDVISVRSLAFKRFLEIAKPLSIKVTVVTDNDGKPERLTAKYVEYADDANIKICFSNDASLTTLEPHMLKAKVKKRVRSCNHTCGCPAASAATHRRMCTPKWIEISASP